MVEMGRTAGGMVAGTGAVSRARARRRRMRPALLLAALVGLGAGTAGCAAPPPEAATHTIEIRAFRFEPPLLMVNAGDTIVWSNEDAVPHTATAADGGWDTGSVASRATSSLVLETPGSHEYVCAFHPNMRAVVTVE